MKEKRYKDETGVLMSNNKLKGFKYSDEPEEIDLSYEVEVKLNALDFYRVIEFLDKIKVKSVKLIADRKNLILKSNNLGLESEIKIPLVYPIENEKVVLNLNTISSSYSVEYLKTILKNYSVKELKDFIFLEFGKDYPIRIKFKEDWIVLVPRIFEIN